MKYTIYKTTNLIDGKIYIGKHQTLDENDDYLGSGKHLKNSIQKYGKENFKKETLYIFDTEEEMNDKEAELVTEDFCKEDTNYNICPGGQGGWGYLNRTGLNISDLQKIKAKESLTKYNKSIQGRLFFSNHMKKLHKQNKFTYGNFKGKKHTDETKEKIGKANSIFQSGSRNSQYGTMWINNGKETKKINKEDIIPEGWNKGRKLTLN